MNRKSRKVLVAGILALTLVLGFGLVGKITPKIDPPFTLVNLK